MHLVLVHISAEHTHGSVCVEKSMQIDTYRSLPVPLEEH